MYGFHWKCSPRTTPAFDQLSFICGSDTPRRNDEIGVLVEIAATKRLGEVSATVVKAREANDLDVGQGEGGDGFNLHAGRRAAL